MISCLLSTGQYLHQLTLALCGHSSAHLGEIHKLIKGNQHDSVLLSLSWCQHAACVAVLHHQGCPLNGHMQAPDTNAVPGVAQKHISHEPIAQG